jgi:CRISPR-associated protein Cas1
MVLLDRAGRFQARLEGPQTGNVLLRRAQYRASEAAADVVRSIVLGKVANQRAVLMRSLRDHGEAQAYEDRGAVEAAAERMAFILRRVERVDETIKALRGSEGEAANLYFAVFGRLIRSPDAGLTFQGRSRRPPLDPVNAVLSFLYTLLAHDCRSACEGVGLDPAVGFLHRDRPGRPSLALDLMEELRAPLADRLTLSLINRRQLRERDFQRLDGGAVVLADEARKLVLTAWQARKKESACTPSWASAHRSASFPGFRRSFSRVTCAETSTPTRPGSGAEMLVLVTYDVGVTDPEGPKRLRRVARACQDWGQRVQASVFEVEVDPGQWAKLKARLEGLIDPTRDSLRFYHLGANWQRRVEHVGSKPAADLGGPLIV